MNRSEINCQNIFYTLERRLKEFGHLLDDFIEAWNCVRDSLETYGMLNVQVYMLYISVLDSFAVYCF